MKDLEKEEKKCLVNLMNLIFMIKIGRIFFSFFRILQMEIVTMLSQKKINK